MDYELNSTKEYHQRHLDSLGWELTVCNALYPENTVLRRVLKQGDSYGHLLYDFLARRFPLDQTRRVIEVGGGYGYLMKDFLDRNNALEPWMLDVSPFLLGKQRETLSGYRVSYRQEDFLETERSFLSGFDLAILNENLGDFPCLTHVRGDMFERPAKNVDPTLAKTLYCFERYGLPHPGVEYFNFNLGAIQGLEKLCESGIPYIFLGEHSCEASVPPALRSLIKVESPGMPERISLRGHDEYSIKFSYLERVAVTLGYECSRGPFFDYIPVPISEEVRHALVSRGRLSDSAEAICQFVEDLYKYEYLILRKA